MDESNQELLAAKIKVLIKVLGHSSFSFTMKISLDKVNQFFGGSYNILSLKQIDRVVKEYEAYKHIHIKNRIKELEHLADKELMGPYLTNPDVQNYDDCNMMDNDTIRKTTNQQRFHSFLGQR